MKSIAFLIVLAFYSIILNSQTSDYENKLAQYMAEFKSNAYNDDIRSDLFEKTETLKNQIGIQINLNNSYNDEYRSLKSTQKKIKAFHNYLSCFSKYTNNEYPKEEFDYVNEILNIYPREVTELTSNLAVFYEISIGKFKAIFVHNKLRQSDSYVYRTIQVEYDCTLNGQLVRRCSFNLAANSVQLIQYFSDKQDKYYNIINIKCKETL